MHWKECGRKLSWPILRYYPSICLEGLRKTTKNLNHDSRSAGQYFDPWPPEYEAGVLTTQLEQSVTVMENGKLENNVAEILEKPSLLLRQLQLCLLLDPYLLFSVTIFSVLNWCVVLDRGNRPFLSFSKIYTTSEISFPWHRPNDNFFFILRPAYIYFCFTKVLGI
jgi:hypothetical protein